VRLLVAHDPRQQRGAPTGVKSADLGADLPQFRGVRRNRQIAQRDRYGAAPDGKAVDPGDDGFRHITDQALKFADGQAHDAAPVMVAFVRRLDAAGAECLFSCAGPDDGRYALAIRRQMRRADAVFQRLAAKRAIDLGAVDDDQSRFDRASSRAKNLVTAMMPPLQAEYAVSFEVTTRAAWDAMLTTRPRLRATLPGQTALCRYSGPGRVMAMIRFHRSASVARKWPGTGRACPSPRC